MLFDNKFTFGAVFPPLIGVILLVVAWNHTTAYTTEVVIGRLLLHAQELGLPGLLNVDHDCSWLHARHHSGRALRSILQFAIRVRHRGRTRRPGHRHLCHGADDVPHALISCI